jgi:nucleoside 2-deoxyribosyltransferase
MKNVFMISPYTIDFLYYKKKEAVDILSKKYDVNFIRAEDNTTGRSLNAEETAVLLHQCSYAIADLSYERPSCYYEVGYLQAIKKPVYLISATNVPLHQALGIGNVMLYDSLNDYEKTIENIIINILEKCEISRKKEQPFIVV